MALEIHTHILGPLENNCYLLADTVSGDAAAVDPSFDSAALADQAAQRGWKIGQVWLTHAHFDHIAGVALLAAGAAVIGLHPADLPLYHSGGGGRQFGMAVRDLPEPTLPFSHGQRLMVGAYSFTVAHTPGHCPGHVVIYSPDADILLCGDVIFQGSVGRTDLPGGSHTQLIASIRREVLTLPAATRLLPGHGPETTVAVESASNPFLQ
jgi:glyoxylase-like metal-dependent hydrolase (beta-lactamase superfamily II)